MVVENRGATPGWIKLDLVCARVAPGVLQPGHDGASVQQYENGEPVGTHTPATSSQPQQPPVGNEEPVPTEPNSTQVTWGPQGGTPLVDEASEQFAIAATASGLVPDTEVVVKSWYVQARPAPTAAHRLLETNFRQTRHPSAAAAAAPLGYLASRRAGSWTCCSIAPPRR